MRHDQCTHPATPAARAACRAGTRRPIARTVNRKDTSAGRTRTDIHAGVPHDPPMSKRPVRTGSAGKSRVLRGVGDLADVPAGLARYARAAWDIPGTKVVFTPHPSGTATDPEYLLHIAMAGDWTKKRPEAYVMIRAIITGPRSIKGTAWYKSADKNAAPTRIRDVIAHIELLAGQRDRTFETKGK